MMEIEEMQQLAKMIAKEIRKELEEIHGEAYLTVPSNGDSKEMDDYWKEKGLIEAADSIGLKV